jgi:hypothetical protein
LFFLPQIQVKVRVLISDSILKSDGVIITILNVTVIEVCVNFSRRGSEFNFIKGFDFCHHKIWHVDLADYRGSKFY